MLNNMKRFYAKPRTVPQSGTGAWVYCIREAGAGQRSVSLGLKKKIKTPNSRAKLATGQAKGIEFGGKISAIPFKDIEAVVSDVDLSQFNEKKIEDKLQEDPKWTGKNI